jgi:predicted metal-dependent hydrolase
MRNTTARRSPHADIAVTPRQAQWNFPADVPRFWFDGSPLLTCMLDAFTLVIPGNERYYIRVLQHCLVRLSDSEQRNEVANFIRQEALHGVAHKSYWQYLQQDGIKVSRFVNVVSTVVYKYLEPLLPQRVHMAMVSAIEHVNAYTGHIFLSRQLLQDADPRLRRLFEWHYAEEIEHKAVAFDALEAAYPGYGTRLIGAALAFPLVYAVLISGTTWLLACRGELVRWRTLRDLYQFMIGKRVLRDTLHFTWRYLQPSFHPWEEDDYALAKPVLESFDGKPLHVSDIGTAAEIPN